jgi:hypothetical protein
VLCVVTSLNIGELADFTRILCRDYASLGRGLELVISPMAPQGDGEKRLDLLPRLNDLGPNMAAALAIAKENGVPARVPHRCGMPLCVTPEKFYSQNMSFYAAPGDNVEAGKRRSPRCTGCAFEDRCVGVWRHYLDQFGDEELRPVAPSDATRARASS